MGHADDGMRSGELREGRQGGAPGAAYGIMLTGDLAPPPSMLAAQARLFESVSETTPDFIYVFDREGRFRYANRRLLEVWGRTLEESLGKTCLELGYEPWHHEMHMREIAQVVETKRPIKGEVPFRAPLTGVFGIYEYIFTPVLGDDGEVELIAGTTRDVTERRQAAAALEESEARFRALLTARWDVVFRVSPDWREMRQLDGHAFIADTSEPTRDWLGKYIHPDDQPRVSEAIQEAISSRSICELEHRIVRSDGALAWAFSRAVPILGAEGQITEWFGAAIDVTARKRAEARDQFLVALDDAVRPLTDPEEITHTSARLLGEHLGADRCAYADIEDDQDTMNLVGNYIGAPDVRSIVGRLRFTDFGAEVLKLMRDNEPYVVHDIDTHEPPVTDKAAYRATQIQAVICVPLHKAGRFVAAMAVHHRTPRRWRPDEVELVQLVGARCWESIERARVLRRLREREAALATDKQVLEQIATGRPLEEVLDTLARGTEAQSDSGMLCSVLVTDHSGRRLRHGAGPSLPEAFCRAIDGLTIGPAAGVCGTAAHERRTLCVPDVQKHALSEEFRRLATEHGLAACCSTPILSGDGRVLGTMAMYYREPGEPSPRDLELIRSATHLAGIVIERHEAEQRLHKSLEAEQQARVEAETLIEVGRHLSSELELEKFVQSVTDAATQVTGAQFGAFFYNVIGEQGESYQLYTISGVPREEFSRFPMPRNTSLFGPTFRNEGIVLIDDVLADERYGKNPPYRGMPEGHLPVRSYLAVPVVSRSGEVLGGLFFGHPETGRFTERHARLVAGIAAQASVGIDNARLYEAQRAGEQRARIAADSERAARSEAERASRMKDEFLATLSHELRTPLNAILGWSQILQRQPSDADELAEGLEVIERNARMQTQLIEDLLDMSRIISGKVRLDVQRLDLGSVVQAAIATARPTAEARGVRLQAVLDPLAGPVSGDPERLQQVFWNLLSNAIKFTPKGGRVQVVLERVNSHLEVSFIDTGEGISPEFLPHVFDRFRQSDGSTTRRHGGLGLGLSIVKQLVELHGGNVRAKSGGEGQGSTFTVSLPLTAVLPGDEPADERRHPRASPDGGAFVSAPYPKLGSVSVVIVDDEPDARALVRRVLEDCNARVRVAGSADEAMALIRAERPDVLVSDIGMPGADGYELIRRVRALSPDAGGEVPAVALTAYARSEDRTRVILAGYQMHIAKPVEPAELCAVVASLAGRVPGQSGRA